jgi:hypothetical protein
MRTQLGIYGQIYPFPFRQMGIFDRISLLSSQYGYRKSYQKLASMSNTKKYKRFIDVVGPVDNRPSTNKINNNKNYTRQVTCDT